MYYIYILHIIKHIDFQFRYNILHIPMGELFIKERYSLIYLCNFFSYVNMPGYVHMNTVAHRNHRDY